MHYCVCFFGPLKFGLSTSPNRLSVAMRLSINVGIIATSLGKNTFSGQLNTCVVPQRAKKTKNEGCRKYNKEFERTQKIKQRFRENAENTTKIWRDGRFLIFE